MGTFVLTTQQQEDGRNGSMRSFIILTKYQQKDELNSALSMREHSEDLGVDERV